MSIDCEGDPFFPKTTLRSRLSLSQSRNGKVVQTVGQQGMSRYITI
jgi:hypothetical protein